MKSRRAGILGFLQCFLCPFSNSSSPDNKVKKTGPGKCKDYKDGVSHRAAKRSVSFSGLVCEEDEEDVMKII